MFISIADTLAVAFKAPKIQLRGQDWAQKTYFAVFFPGISGVSGKNGRKHLKSHWGIVFRTLPKQFKHPKQRSWSQSHKGAYSCMAFDIFPPPPLVHRFSTPLSWSIQLSFTLAWAKLCLMIKLPYRHYRNNYKNLS